VKGGRARPSKEESWGAIRDFVGVLVYPTSAKREEGEGVKSFYPPLGGKERGQASLGFRENKLLVGGEGCGKD